MAEARGRINGRTYALSTVTPPAGNGLRFSESGVTYEIEAIDPADPSASPFRFDHPTVGTLALVGSPLPIDYTELFTATFTVTTPFTWEEKDLSGYGVPGGCVAEIRIEYPGVYSSGDLEAIVGCRQMGSATNRWMSIQPYVSGLSTVTMLVNVDANGKIEIYSNYLTGITHVPKSNFRVIGYFTNATYTETWISIPTTTDAWRTDNLFTDHGIPKGSVIEVLMGTVSNDFSRVIGLRKTGAAGRTYNISRGYYGSGGHWVRVFETTSVANGQIDSYVSTDDSYGTHICIGYWDDTVEYVLDGTEYAPLNTSVWEDKNIGLAQDKIPNFAMYNLLTTGPRTVGIREDGSALSRYHAIERSRLATYMCMWSACANMVAANTVEMYSTNLTEGKLILDGYLQAA